MENNISGIWTILFIFLKKLIREILRVIWEIIKRTLKSIWKFLIKRRSIRRFPRLRAFIIKYAAILGVMWIAVTPFVFRNIDYKEITKDTWNDLFTETIVVEANVDASSGEVSLVEKTEATDMVANEEVSQIDESSSSGDSGDSSDLEEILNKIHILESSGGVNNFSKCEAQGLFNEYGYGITGGKYLCFEKGKDREAVEKRIKELLTSHDLDSTICGYNLGFNHVHFKDCLNLSDDYPYLKKFKQIGV